MSTPIESVRAVTPIDRALGGVAPSTQRTGAPLPFTSAAAAPRIEAGAPAAARLAPYFPAASDAPIVLAPEALLLTVIPLGEGDAMRHTLRDLAQMALVEAADTWDQSPARFADAAPIVSDGERPARNDPDAQSAMRHTTLAKDSLGDVITLDLHVARTTESGWEAAAFDAGCAARSGSFPYLGGPLFVAELQFDGRAGQFRLSDRHRMLQVVPLPVAPKRTIGPAPLLAVAVVVGLAGVALVLGRVFA